MTYQAIVAPIYTRPTPNADNLFLGNVLGFQVLVGKDTENGQLGIYFPTDGQLSKAFCDAHNLIGTTETIIDPVTGETKQKRTGGFFDEKRRVKTLKLRKEKSDGFWVPLSYLEFTGDISHLKEGDLFTEVNGIEICQKYVTQATQNAIKGQAVKIRKNNIMFPRHEDTDQLLLHLQDIKPGSLITLTGKLHGTSHRMANVLVEKSLSVWEKLWNKLFWKYRIISPKMEWREIHGTRKVQLDDVTSAGDGFYGVNFRDNATKQLQGRLKKGEAIYLEIVGWVTSEIPIMTPHDLLKKHSSVSDKDRKELIGLYGEKMYFNYGCLPGENKIFIYRITQNNEDGHVIELSWKQVQRRAEELGVPTVPEYHQFILGQTGCWNCGCGQCDKGLTDFVEEYLDKPDILDKRHISEGVVIRVDGPDGITNLYKHKSFWFKVFEGIIKDNPEVADVEESS